MAKDIIEEQLSTTSEERNLEEKPSEREEEFSKVMDVVTIAREDFLAGEEMSLEDAISRIRGELAALLPKPTGQVDARDAIAGMRPPGLGSLGR